MEGMNMTEHTVELSIKLTKLILANNYQQHVHDTQW